MLNHPLSNPLPFNPAYSSTTHRLTANLTLLLDCLSHLFQLLTPLPWRCLTPPAITSSQPFMFPAVITYIRPAPVRLRRPCDHRLHSRTARRATLEFPPTLK